MSNAKTPPQEETIEARVSSVTFRHSESSFAILALDRIDRRETMTAIGNLKEFHKGDKLSLVGRFETHDRYGLQFRVSAAHPIPPQGQDEIREYLINAKVKGVAAKRVDLLIEHFGADTLNVIINHPERLKSLGGFGESLIDRLREAVRSQAGRQEIMLFLYSLQLSAVVAAKIWAKYLERSREIIEENPYQMISEIEFFDFQLADRVARHLEWSPHRLERMCAALAYLLTQAQDDGHVCLPEPELLNRAAQFTGSRDRAVEALQHALKERDLVAFKASDTEEDVRFIYLSELGYLERDAAREVRRLTRQEVHALNYDLDALESESELTLAEAQREAIEVASRASMLLLTGGPGTGKTTTVRALISLFDQHELVVKLAAPTGRAARRLSDTTGHDAQTIHRLLDYQPQEEIFRRGPEAPLEADLVLIDETSMVDLRLFVALLRALPRQCRLILVGDANQLPSVGPGRVYRDLLLTEMIPTVTLEVVFRQAQESSIITNAYQILKGQPLTLPPPTEPVESVDFFNIRARESAQAAELIEQLITDRIPQRFEVTPAQIQIITPMYRGHCGADQLNRRLQQLLNPQGKSVHKTSPLRVGDRVMQLKNDYDKDVYNGDTGTIIARHDEGAVVDFEGRVVNYDKQQLFKLTLAYACSIHKSQGSEYPAVIIPVLDEHWSMLQRDLLYTAVTRGQRLVVLVSTDSALERAICHLVSSERCTHLHTRLIGGTSSSSPL